MKEKAVRLSGVVYVKDPGDAEKIKKLQNEINRLREEVRSLSRAVKPADALRREAQRLKSRASVLKNAESILRQRHATIQRFKRMKVKTFLEGRQGFWYGQEIKGL